MMWSDDVAAGEPTVQQLLEVYRIKKQTAATKVPQFFLSSAQSITGFVLYVILKQGPTRPRNRDDRGDGRPDWAAMICRNRLLTFWYRPFAKLASMTYALRP